MVLGARLFDEGVVVTGMDGAEASEVIWVTDAVVFTVIFSCQLPCGRAKDAIRAYTAATCTNEDIFSTQL